MGIVILDEATASKIAAGEVIERPASVVKELIENALDAGARRIEVEVREAGRGLLRVSDDGCGMTREDAVLSLQRHATSKLVSADDLFAISTLGFRGEALPSIASVSHFTLTTRAEGADSGSRLGVVGGEVTELEEVGAPVGTEVSVERLFYNTPARLKFLKRDAAEAGHIQEVLTRFLFSHPQVSFCLRVDGREVVRHSGSPDLRAAVLAAWGRELAEAMLSVEKRGIGVSLTGLISPPLLQRATRSHQFLYVNRRWVRNRTLAHAVDEAYRGVLPDRRFPAVILLLEVEPHAVDVNVHPTKAEVRLSREQEIHHLVYAALREALESAGAPAMRFGQTAGPPAVAPQVGQEEASTQQQLGAGWAGTLAAPGLLSPAFRAAVGDRLELRPLAQLRDTYILAESRAGLLLVDQHRAEERIRYERLTQARLSQRAPSQALLAPAAVQLGSREAAAIAQQLDDLGAVGFQLEPFGRDAFLVRAVPAQLREEDAGTLIRDLAEELSADSQGTSIERRREKLLITLCCRASVKAGDRLSYDEMAELLESLTATARPYTCPHGWPIVMTISNLEIDRKFNR
ncbi:MAG: DNA mismatch repair endonuclease MutL [Armatimonadota bacterium]